MRNWPPIHALLVLVALCALAIPLARLVATRPSPAFSIPSPPSTESIGIMAILRFAHPPESFSLRQGDRLLWSGGDSKTTEFEKTLAADSDSGYVDIAVEVHWPSETPRTVVELELLPDGAEAVIRSAWGEGEFSTTFSFPIE